MTSPGASLSKFQGLPWEFWTNALERTSPIHKPPETKQEKNKGGVMKLHKEDMKIFGLCPERDSFTAVICDVCNMCIKQQALEHHYERRHPNKINSPPPQTITEVVTDKVATKVVKTVVKKSSSKTETKKNDSTKSNKNKEEVTPSFPVSLTLEASITNPGVPNPAIAPTSLVGALASPATPVLIKPSAPAMTPASLPPVLIMAQRPPCKHATIKEREYDPDKHCGVISTETMKPCTRSLTCKLHRMTLRRVVTGRSKPFNQLLFDHRQANEMLLKEKKNLELQNSVVKTTPGLPQPELQVVVEKPMVETAVTMLPELNLNITSPQSAQTVYLPASPKSVSAHNSTFFISQPTTSALTPTTITTQLDIMAFTINPPKGLNGTAVFSSHKVGGLVYTNRRMQIARQGLESSLYRASNGIYSCSAMPLPSTLSNVIYNMTSRVVKGVKRTNLTAARTNKRLPFLKKQPVYSTYKSVV